MFTNIDWNKGDNDFFAERSRQIKEDPVKSFLLLPKFVLQLISVWPETQTIITKILRNIGIFLLVTLFVLNVWYLYDVSNDFAQAAIIFTTVNVTVQAFTRFYTLIIYQKEFAEIITVVWKQFWLLNVLPENQARVVKKSSKLYYKLIVIYVFGAVATATSYCYRPILGTRREFAIMPKLPASFYNNSPQFELVTVIMWWMSYYPICFPYLAFDTLYCGLIYNCSVQFKILRLRLNNLVEEEQQNESIAFQEEKTRLLIEYILHHKLLIRTCDTLKKVFQHFLLIQLIQSAIAICFCTFAGMVIPAVTIQMMIFSSTSIMQLFLYCCFGNELTHQSRTVSYAAFRCGWHYLHHKKLSKLLIMLMHKAQLGEELSARGFTPINFASFMRVLRTSFSFYTVLRAMLDKIEAKHK